MKKLQGDKREKIEARITPDVQKGGYANAIRITATDSEVVLDFAFIHSQDEEHKSAEVVSRLIVNPNFAQKISEYINKTLEEHNSKKKQQ